MRPDDSDHANFVEPGRYDSRVTTSGLDIVPVTQARFGDLAALFEEGGDPKWCWCTYFRVRGRSWSNATPAGNRKELEGLAARDPDEHSAPGLVAYREGRAIGWVSLGPRDDYDRLAHSRVLAPVDNAPVWSIVCFVVSRRARGKGVAAALLDAAIAYARDNGATLLEGYPVDTGQGRVPAASAYQGTLPMFERAGFRVVARRQWNATAPIRPIVRLELTPKRRGR
jgi:GNAT superfamily N-acetyltransferase